MADMTITCPKCSAAVPLTESLAAPLLKETRAKYEQALAKKDQDLAQREQHVREQHERLEHDRKTIDQQVAEKLETGRKRISEEEAAKANRLAASDIAAKAQEITELNAVLQDRESKLAIAQTAQADLMRKERELEDARREMDLTIQTKVQAELAPLRERATREAQGAAQLRVTEKEEELASLRRDLEERDTKLAAAQKAQAEIIQKERDLDNARREIDLTIQNKVQAELGDLRLKAKQEADAEAKLPLIERDQKIASMQKQIEELVRKAEQGSQQAQGEALELHLEELLRANFTRDIIEAVPKGEHGGDILHRVVGAGDQPIGTILWESKRTKNFSDGWLPKLREYQRSAGADVALIVTSALPKGVLNFCLMDGVWITDARCAVPVAIMLRKSLIDIAAARLASEGQQTKMELTYRYLTSAQFKHRVAAIVERCIEMRDDLDRERRVAMKQFARRDQQIRGTLDSMAGLYGDLQGIAGKAIEEIEALAMPLLENRPANNDDESAAATQVA
jgi:hypothetical protein